MELVKCQIHSNNVPAKVTDQFFIDEDVNVPDSKGDISRIVFSEGTLHPEEVRHMENYVRVTGKLWYRILYVTDEGERRMSALDGKIPFEEMIYIEGKEGHFQITDSRVDFTASMIHSRKISVKAVADMEISADEMKDEELTMDVDTDMSLFKKKRDISLLQLTASKKDLYRIKEEMTVPGAKESIGTLLWSDVVNRKAETRLAADAILIRGELQVFLFYESPEGKMDWLEQTIPYEGQIDVGGVDEGMYHHVLTTLGDVNVDLRLDEDGEMRLVGIEGALDLKIAVFREEQLEVLEDVYSLEKQCKIEESAGTFERLVLQNLSKCKVAEQLTLPELTSDILQICHTKALLQIESIRPVDEGMQVDGILHVSFLYVKASDDVPFETWQGMVPFSHVIESNESAQNMRYDIAPMIETAGVTLLGSGQVEIKAMLVFQSMFRCPFEVRMIHGIELEDIDREEMEKRPGVTGYIVKKGDDLWSLAKRYCTTPDGIREMNGIGDGEIKEGDKILIFKESMGIL